MAGLGLKRGKAYKRKREEYFFEYVRQAADRPLRREARAAGRLQGLHDHRPGAAVGRPHGHQGEPLLRRRPGRGRRDGRLPEGLHPRDGLEPALQRGQPVQPGDPGPAPARLDVQDLRADPGDPRGHQPVHDALRQQEARLRRPAVRPDRRVDLLQHLPRRDPDRVGAAQLRQLGLPAADARRRPREGHRDGVRHGHLEGAQPAGRRLDRPRRRRGDARSTWPTPTRRCRTAATASQPLAISKIVKPNGSEDVFAPERDARLLRRRRLRGDAHPAEQRHRRHRDAARQIGVPAGRQDRHDRATTWTPGSSATRPNYSTAVWVGYPNSDGAKRSMYSVHGITVAGGTFPALDLGTTSCAWSSSATAARARSRCRTTRSTGRPSPATSPARAGEANSDVRGQVRPPRPSPPPTTERATTAAAPQRAARPRTAQAPGAVGPRRRPRRRRPAAPRPGARPGPAHRAPAPVPDDARAAARRHPPPRPP